MNLPLALFGSMPGWGEMLVIAMVGLIFFGRRLPEVGRSIGRTIVEFRKGIQDVKDDVETASTRPSGGAQPPPPRIEHQQTIAPPSAPAPPPAPAEHKSPAEQSS